MIEGRKLNSWKEGKRSAVFVRIKLSEIRLDSSSEEEMSRCLSGELFPSQMTHFLGIKFFWDPERQNDSFLSKLKKGSRSPLIGLISFVCVIPFWTRRFIDLVIPAFSSSRSGTGRLHSISHNSLVGSLLDELRRRKNNQWSKSVPVWMWFIFQTAYSQIIIYGALAVEREPIDGNVGQFNRCLACFSFFSFFCSGYVQVFTFEFMGICSIIRL